MTTLPKPGARVMVPVILMPVVLGYAETERIVEINGEGHYFATVESVGTRKADGVPIVRFRPYQKQTLGIAPIRCLVEGWPVHPKIRNR